jgi:hypothetical protein
MELFDPVYLDWNTDQKVLHNFDYFGPLRYNLEEVRDGNFRLAGYAGWTLYGLLIITNFVYYSDAHYDRYIMSNYADTTKLALRTWWGTSTFARSIGKIAIWGMAGLFWGISFFRDDWTLVLFWYITVFILVSEILSLAAHFGINIASIFIDHAGGM